MGLFDSLFGGGKKAEAPKKKEKKAVPAAQTGLTPEVVAAISASINMVMNDDAEIIAAITAAVVHAGGGSAALHIKRSGNAWAASGRQKIMDGRQSF
ncbi:hypothetical protein [Acetonema longum]|uniref:Uncharacterized protein n=1 Tax=Acetonema longum DSM 6540 TaxID=1009370 RepID=F7NNM4_9FIRM|nr:hypothetical protein [Acetonema longum]EGO62355.1 hypothetical protein ALO_18577 [Acetonema longum DSM 6540]